MCGLIRPGVLEAVFWPDLPGTLRIQEYIFSFYGMGHSLDVHRIRNSLRKGQYCSRRWIRWNDGYLNFAVEGA